LRQDAPIGGKTDLPALENEGLAGLDLQQERSQEKEDEHHAQDEPEQRHITPVVG
jgi:hypothetical protein